MKILNLIIVITFISCNSTIQLTTNHLNKIFNGKVEKISTFIVEPISKEFELNDNLVNDNNFSRYNKIPTEMLEFDKKGRIKLIKNYNFDNIVLIENYSYINSNTIYQINEFRYKNKSNEYKTINDKFAKITKISIGNLIDEKKFLKKLNDSRQTIEKKEFDKDSTLIYTSYYYYNDNGYLIKSLVFDKNNDTIKTTELSYNTTNFSSTTVTKEETIKEYIEHDQLKNILREEKTTTKNNKSTIEKSQYFYDYSDNENPILLEIEIQHFQKEKDIKLLSSKTKFLPNGLIESQVVDNVFKGKESLSFKYKLDEHLNWIRKDTYDKATNKIIEIKIREIVYQ